MISSYFPTKKSVQKSFFKSHKLNNVCLWAMVLASVALPTLAKAESVTDISSGRSSMVITDLSPDANFITGYSRETANGADIAYYWSAQNGFQEIHPFNWGGQTIVYSYGYGISKNGTTVVGESSSDAGTRAFRWTPTTGIQNLGTLGGDSRAYNVSADGSVVIGSYDQQNRSHAFRWTTAGGMQDLGIAGTESDAFYVSDDGRIIAGLLSTIDGYQHAFRWTEATGGQDLGTLGGLGNTSQAFGMSADGQVIVGQSASPTGYHAFRWTETGGMQDLGTLGGDASSASDVSENGKVVIGISNGTGAERFSSLAFRWTEANGMQNLGNLGGTEAIPRDVSANGGVIVGTSLTAQPQWHAFVWTEAEGMRDINTVLTQKGVNMGNLTLAQAEKVSDDGSTIFAYDNTLLDQAKLYLVRLASAGVSTPQELINSVSSLGNLPSVMIGDVHSSMMNQARYNVMPVESVKVAAADSDTSWKTAAAAGQGHFWGYVSGAGAFSNDSLEGDASVGGIWQATSSLRLGAGPVLGGHHVDLSRGGDAGIASYGLDMFAALEPDAEKGPRLYTNVYGRRLKAHISRGYLNGATEVQSSGDTSGLEYGIAAEAGWRMPTSEAFAFTPYVGIDYSHSRLNGYSEDNGPFPATFEDLTYKRTLASAGVRAEYKASSRTNLWASAAYVHNLSNDNFTVRGAVAGLGNVSTQVDLEHHRKNWIEPAVGANWDLSDKARLITYVKGKIEDHPEGQVGISLGFKF